LVEKFLLCKIISSKTDLRSKFSSKFFWYKIFNVARTFPRKQDCTQNFHQKLIGQKRLIIAKSFPQKLV